MEIEKNDKLSSIWAEAYKSCLASVGDKHKLDDPRFPPPASAAELLNGINKQDGKFTEFRDKRKEIWNALNWSMRPLELLGNVAAGPASTVG